MERTLARDSIGYELTARNEQRYDTLSSRMKRRAISRMIYDVLFTHRSSASPMDDQVRDGAEPFRPYEGQRIARIDITPLGLLAGSDSSWFERAASELHVTSQPSTIRRDLLFAEGQRVDPALIIATQQLLQERPWISDVAIDIRPHESVEGEVVVDIVTRDSWTISGDGDISGGGPTSLMLYDANFLGYGVRLETAEHFDWRNGGFHGLEVALRVPNILSTHFDAQIAGGKALRDSHAGIDLHKAFLTPSDYAGGVRLEALTERTRLLYRDDTMQIKSRQAEVWAGKSFYISELKSSLYLAGRYASYRFERRPEVAQRLNPAFHERRLAIGSVGLYRERFYTSNLIYGYGRREYLSTGYLLAATAGYEWGEEEDRWYGSLSYRLGKFIGWGYLAGSAELGSYYSPAEGRFSQGALRLGGYWFSNLWRTGGRTRMRQFVTLSLLRGFNRYAGSEELVSFDHDYELRNLSPSARMAGIHRASLSVESVLFTPWQPLGFQLALFAFADTGTLGSHGNLLRNPFYSTLGVGVRFKNERLIFNALEIRLGLAVSKRGLLPAQYVAMSTQERVAPMSFRPVAPGVIPYR